MYARRPEILTESKDLNSQEKPGKSQSIGGLDRLLSDDQTIYAVSEICGKGQDAQYCRWWHEHPRMIVKLHIEGEVMARGQPLCVEVQRLRWSRGIC